MKAAIVCALALVALASAAKEIEVEGNDKAQLQLGGRFTRLRRIRAVGDEEFCSPGQTRIEGCDICRCTAEGYGWDCTPEPCRDNGDQLPDPGIPQF